MEYNGYNVDMDLITGMIYPKSMCQSHSVTSSYYVFWLHSASVGQMWLWQVKFYLLRRLLGVKTEGDGKAGKVAKLKKGEILMVTGLDAPSDAVMIEKAMVCQPVGGQVFGRMTLASTLSFFNVGRIRKNHVPQHAAR